MPDRSKAGRVPLPVHASRRGPGRGIARAGGVPLDGNLSAGGLETTVDGALSLGPARSRRRDERRPGGKEGQRIAARTGNRSRDRFPCLKAGGRRRDHLLLFLTHPGQGFRRRAHAVGRRQRIRPSSRTANGPGVAASWTSRVLGVCRGRPGIRSAGSTTGTDCGSPLRCRRACHSGSTPHEATDRH